MSYLIKLSNIVKTYAGQSTPVLNDFSLTLAPGRCVAITGPSGCGKSTLLKIIGLLETPCSGDYYFSNRKLSLLSFRQQAQLRNQSMGFIFQQFHLIPHLTVLENICVPLWYRGMSRKAAAILAQAQLAAFDMMQYKMALPRQLSGGQQQRVAIARALVGTPSLILADEPTAALDPDRTEQVFTMLKALTQKNCTVLFVTHDTHLSQCCDEVIDLACA